MRKKKNGMGMEKKDMFGLLFSIKDIIINVFSWLGFSGKTTPKPQEFGHNVVGEPEVISIEIPSVPDAIQQKKKQDNTSSPQSPKVMSYSTSGGNMIIPNLAIGNRREMNKTPETIKFEYWGKVDNGHETMDSLTRENYPFTLIPQTGSQILAYTLFEGTVNGVSEPKLYEKLRHFEEIEPEIQVLKNVSLPIKKRNYGYKPDIAIKWESRSICIDVEIDEPYDILSRKPIHYTDEDCSDYLRNAYFLEKGWYVIRIAEEQVIKDIDKVYNYVLHIIFMLSQDERFKATDDIEPRKRWSQEEAQKLAEKNYREEYLEIEPVKATPEPVSTTQEVNKEGGYNIPENYTFSPPNTDVIDSPYSKLSNQMKEEAEKCQYFKIKKSGNGYEYITNNDKIKYFFHGIRLFDIVEDKEYYLSFADIDSYKGKENIKIEKGEREWPYIMYDAIVNCRPIHIVYDKTSEPIPTERTIIYLVPYLKYTEGAQRFIEKYSKMGWLKMCSLHFYSDLCNLEQYPECSGYCLYRNDLRAFNSYRILEGYVYDCFKPLAEYDTEHMLDVLEKGDGRLAEIIYSHFTDKKKGEYYNVANNAHALVMQGRLDDALILYNTYSKDYAIPNNGTWGDAIFADFNSYISKGIHKAEFEEMKKLFEE